jgi:hypothetical protein
MTNDFPTLHLSEDLPESTTQYDDAHLGQGGIHRPGSQLVGARRRRVIPMRGP